MNEPSREVSDPAEEQRVDMPASDETPKETTDQVRETELGQRQESER